MKKMLCILLGITLLCSLTGCAIGGGKDPTQTHFYYSRMEYQFDGKETSAIVPEKRDIAGHAGDLNYVLSLYLMGPLDETLKSPFPSYTKLLSAQLVDGDLQLELSDSLRDLTGTAFSVACGCLTLTCLELAEVNTVIITSGERIVTMDADSMILQDILSEETTNGGT